LRAYKHLRVHVLVFKEGLARLSGEELEVLRWDEVETVRQKVIIDFRKAALFGERHLILRRKDGGLVEFDDVMVPRLFRLTVLVQQLSLPQLLTAALEAYGRGETLPFGKLSASREGIRRGRKLLPWGDVRECKAARGRLTITRNGRWLPWFRGSVAKVDNVLVLIGLVQVVKAVPALSPAGSG
jgi:hypothetical protein